MTPGPDKVPEVTLKCIFGAFFRPFLTLLNGLPVLGPGLAEGVAGPALEDSEAGLRLHEHQFLLVDLVFARANWIPFDLGLGLGIGTDPKEG